MSQIARMSITSIVLTFSWAAHAADQQPPDVVKLSISPAPAPVPALRYRLLPTLDEQKPGNAAPFYYRALLAYSTIELTKDEQALYDKLEESTVDSTSVEDARRILDKYAVVFDEVREATYREHCDWDWRVQDLGENVATFRMQEVQEIRQIARLVVIKARMHLAEGRFDEAFETMRMNYALARALSEPPVIIGRLVGIAIAAITDVEKAAWSGRPDSPNLYWAQTFLDRPLIDMASATWQERSTGLNLFPFLRDAETAQRSEDEWTSLYVQAIQSLGELNVQGAAVIDIDTARSRIAKQYPIAKQELIAHGFDKDRIEKMSQGQVVAIQDARAYEYAFDELFKWTTMSGPAARGRYRESEAQLKAEGYLNGAGQRKYLLPLADSLMPAANSAYESVARTESRNESYRVIEALRMHLAAGAQELPKSLDEIKIVPVPINSYTGEPFPYRVEGETAFLEIPPMQGWSRIYEITVRKQSAKVTKFSGAAATF